MLHETYIQQELQRVNSRRFNPTAEHTPVVHEMLRQRSLVRRAARIIGVMLQTCGAHLQAFGGANPRVSPPVPPIVEFRIVK